MSAPHAEQPGSSLVPVMAPEIAEESQLPPAIPGPTYEDLGGLDHEIEQLQRIGAIFSNPTLAAEWDVHVPTGLLLCGPGGVGKTELVRAFSHDIGAELLEVAVSDVQSKWTGESNQNLKSWFDKANKVGGKAVLFFDELDGLFSQHAGGNGGVATALISEMKTLMQGVRRNQPNTIVAGSTNSLDGFDPALLRPGRFDVVMQIAKPGEAARASIFGKIISSRLELYNVGFGDAESSRGAIDIASLSAATDGMTGADIKDILHAARARKAFSPREPGEMPTPLTQDEILQSISRHRLSRVNAVE